MLAYLYKQVKFDRICILWALVTITSYGPFFSAPESHLKVSVISCVCVCFQVMPPVHCWYINWSTGNNRMNICKNIHIILGCLSVNPIMVLMQTVNGCSSNSVSYQMPLYWIIADLCSFIMSQKFSQFLWNSVTSIRVWGIKAPLMYFTSFYL